MTKEEAIKEWVMPAIVLTWDKKRSDEIIKALEQEPKTGHWIAGDGCREVYAMEYECSECGCNVIGGGDFCKWCGAKMVVPQESEDKE